MHPGGGDPGKRVDPGGGADPYFQARLKLRRGAREFHLVTPHSVFSSSRIDGGTILLLDHLPQGTPRSFLDLGCGYGALGLPVAAEFPDARGVLIDRDLLAVEFTRRNAGLSAITNVEIRGGLGYGDLPASPSAFDWILCNIPARVGDRVIAHFISAGMGRLRAGGELRLVIISPLASSVDEAAARYGLERQVVARSARHAVFAFPAAGPREAGGGLDVYLRDTIRLDLPERLVLHRPTDLADEPHRLTEAIPLLAGSLPREEPSRILAFRSGYGLVPALALERYPRAEVVAQDRDLLATAFTAWNCEGSRSRLRVEATVDLEPLQRMGPFDLALGELSPPLGVAATLHELNQVRSALALGGKALIVGLSKQWKDLERASPESTGFVIRRRRGPVALLEMRGAG